MIISPGRINKNILLGINKVRNKVNHFNPENACSGKMLVVSWNGIVDTVQLNSTKSELGFCAGSNPAHGMLEVCDDDPLMIVPVGKKA